MKIKNLIHITQWEKLYTYFLSQKTEIISNRMVDDKYIELIEPLILIKNNFLHQKENKQDSLEKSSSLLESKIDNKNMEENSSKYDKKIKNNNREDDLLEIKRNRGKNRKKTYSKFDLEDEENFSQSINEKNISTISMSLTRPPKLNKIKKIQKVKIISSSLNLKERVNDQQTENIKLNYDSNTKLVINQNLNVRQLANHIGVAENEIIKFLFLKGLFATINQILDLETIKLVVKNFNVDVEIQSFNKKVNSINLINGEDLNLLEKRSPVVTIMGHIDHGKTTLLDYIKKTNIVAKEKGGITQSLLTYVAEINFENRLEKIIFLDTPGHQAFSSMRSRGLGVTDIVILIVAADDGVQPQTKEAIDLIKESKKSVIVAINKVDKEVSNINKVKEDLAKYDVIPEEWGGHIPFINISALTGYNVEKLLETVLLIAELENYKANFNSNAKGTVIESYLDKAKGPVANLLVQNGCLKISDIIVAGSTIGKVRVIIDYKNQKVSKVYPSSPVEVWGFENIPLAGDFFEVVKNEKEAKAKLSLLNIDSKNSFFNSADILKNINKNKNLKQFKFILKTDIQGSIEAIVHALKEIPQNKVKFSIISAAPGEITDTDIEFALASNSQIIGFNTNFAPGTKQASEKYKIKILNYQIIYDLFEYVKSQMEELLDPVYEEKEIGRAVVKTIFNIAKGLVAGCYVTSGKLVKDTLVNILRNQKIVYQGKLDSLKRIKEDVNSINLNNECGVFILDFQSWQENDIIIDYERIEKKASL